MVAITETPKGELTVLTVSACLRQHRMVNGQMKQSLLHSTILIVEKKEVQICNDCTLKAKTWPCAIDIGWHLSRRVGNVTKQQALHSDAPELHALQDAAPACLCHQLLQQLPKHLASVSAAPNFQCHQMKHKAARVVCGKIPQACVRSATT